MFSIDYDGCIDKDACHKNAYYINFDERLSYGCQCKDKYRGVGFSCSKGILLALRLNVLYGR